MSEYQCPKCGGIDYFMSKRNVVTGIGGIYGNRGGVKEFPVCRVCDEIMASTLKLDPIMVLKWGLLAFLILIVIVFV